MYVALRVRAKWAMPVNNVPSRAIFNFSLQMLACFATRGRYPGTSRLGAGRARYAVLRRCVMVGISQFSHRS